MTRIPIASRRFAPLLLGGASGIHIMTRLWRASRAPASAASVSHFVLHNSDVALVICGGSLVTWYLLGRPDSNLSPGRPNGLRPQLRGSVTRATHRVRQLSTALLIGLGTIQRRAQRGEVERLGDVVQRLNGIVHELMGEVATIEGLFQLDYSPHDVR